MKVGNYILKQEELCVTVTEEVVTKAGAKTKAENIGKIREEIVGYFTSYASAFRFLLSKEISKEELQDLETVVKRIETFEKEIRQALGDTDVSK